MSTPLAPIDDLDPGPPPFAPAAWPFLATLPTALAATSDTVAAFRKVLADGDTSLKLRFADDEPVEGLVRDRALMVDIVLRSAWQLHVGAHANEVDLIAVGGYGRGELHPCSDIDVLILLPKSEVVAAEAGIERFLAFLWDIGLEVGHSVRTIDDCQRESAADVSVATTFIEARLLADPDPRPGEGSAAQTARSVVVEGVLRSEGCRTAVTPSPLPRHRLQPRTEREGEPGRPARHPDDRLGRQAPFRRRDAR